MSNQVLEEVQTELKNKRFRVETDRNYHGIDVSVYAQNEDHDDKIFMYVLDTDRALPAHIWNLHEIKEGNSRILRIPNCNYLVYAPLGAVEHARIAAKKYGIPILTSKDDLIREIKKYSSKRSN